MTPQLILFISLATAFSYAEYLNKPLAKRLMNACDSSSRRFKIGEYLYTHKPFTCSTCLTGWFSLIGGLIVYGWSGFVFLPIGVFVGALVNSFWMRWL